MLNSAYKKFLELYPVRPEENGHVYLNCAEIGVKEGKHAEMMLQLHPNTHFVLVDPYLAYYTETEWETRQDLHDKKYRYVLERQAMYPGRVQVYRVKSHEAAAWFPDGKFDYIFIDADHTRDEVRRDIECWYPKMKVGGLFSGHDWDIVGPFIVDMIEGIEHDTIGTFGGETCKDWWVVKK